MPAWFPDTQHRLEKIRQATVAWEATARANAPTPVRRPSGQGPVPLTDPDSRIMKTTAGGVQGDTAQAAVEAASQISVRH